MATATVEAVRFVGMPEGHLAISALVLFLSVAPKSNSALVAYAGAGWSMNTAPCPCRSICAMATAARRARWGMAPAIAIRTTSPATTCRSAICPTSFLIPPCRFIAPRPAASSRR